MSPNRPRSAAWAPAAVLALLLVPAWSDVAGRRAPCAPVEDRGPPRVAARPRAAPVQWSIGDPTDEEQLLLELMNRARADPAAEGDRVFEDYGSSVVTSAVDFFLKQSPGVEYTRAENRDAFHTYAARPPFAFDAHLLDAARVHSQLMRQFNVQSHRVTQAGEKALRDRLTDAGFDGTSLAESVFAYAQDMLDAHAGFAIDYGQGVLQGETRPYLGHRLSLMGFDGDPARNYAVVGVGAISDPDDPGDPNDVGPRLVTIDFGIPANAPTSFVTGVCWADLNQNGFYDLGEGLSGVRIDLDVGSAFAISTSSGGYAVPVDGAPGTVHVTATGGVGSPGEIVGTQTATVTMTGANVKVDFSTPPDPPVPAVIEAVSPSAFPIPDTGFGSQGLLVAAQAGSPDETGDVEVEISMTHPARADVKVTLIGPDATQVVLFDHGPPGADLRGTFDRSLSPREPLDAFLDRPYAGLWTLRVDDTAAGSTGTVNSWRLRVRPKWVRPLFSHASPLAVSQLKLKDVAKPAGDSLTIAAQVDVGAKLVPGVTGDLRLRTADAVHTEILHVALPATAIKAAVKSTSRNTLSATFKGLDLPAPLPAQVEVEIVLGDAVVRETIPLAAGAFSGAKTLPVSGLFRIGSVATKPGKSASTYTVTGRLSPAGAVAGAGPLEVTFGALTFKEPVPSFTVAGAKSTYKSRLALRKLVIDTAKGVFQMTIVTAADVLPGTATELTLRLPGGFYGAATVVPRESGSSITY